MDIITKSASDTDPKYGINPKDRTTEEILHYGIVNIDKQSGPTSHQISDYVKKILRIKKAGHSGTLDPRVTGVLPIALDRGTKVVNYLLTAGKEYVAIMHLHKPIDENKIREIMTSMVGKMMQLPPIKSAVKRQIRVRSIYYFDILEINKQDVLFKVGCQAGTYIRKLCHDIGVKLGCGAHMADLRRTKAGPFDESTLFTLNDLADAIHYYNQGDETFIRKMILPVEDGVSHLKKVWVFDSAIDSICNGAILAIPGISKLNHFNAGETIAIMSLKDELVAIGEASVDSGVIIRNEKGIAVRPSRVFMKIGVYPPNKPETKYDDILKQNNL